MCLHYIKYYTLNKFTCEMQKYGNNESSNHIESLCCVSVCVYVWGANETKRKPSNSV